jgi:hypothetical protein
VVSSAGRTQYGEAGTVLVHNFTLSLSVGNEEHDVWFG